MNTSSVADQSASTQAASTQAVSGPEPAIHLQTEVPGPRSIAILARREAAIPRGLSQAMPVVLASAHGARLTDVDGNRFIDFAAGIGTMNVGHGSPTVVAAVQAQAAQLTHTCFTVAAYEPYVALAERLCALTPGTFAKKAILLNTGAEAIENAVKIARAATGRANILCFEDGFHGRTMMALAMTSKVQPYKAGFGPFPGDVVRVPYAYPYRATPGATPDEVTAAALAAIDDRFRRYVDPATIAAVVVEPVLGEGGFVVPPIGFLRDLAALCRRHGILVIADEIQTGFGRTGRLFACEHDGLEPDLLVTAKSLAAGLPLSAVVGRAELMDAPGPGGLGGTYAGNPVACASALAVLDLFASQDFLARSEAIGARIEAEASTWQATHPLIGDVRRRGSMVGVELVRDRATREPAPQETTAIARLACRRGVLLITAGTYNNVIRFLTPLVITDAELDEGLAVVTACVAEIAGRTATA